LQRQPRDSPEGEGDDGSSGPGLYPCNLFGKGYVVIPELPENEVT
jgi:hypothetical protein